MEIIYGIVFIAVIYFIWKALVSTPQGAFMLVVLPAGLLCINFTIAWENYWEGIPFPNPINPGGFINDVIAHIIGGMLDSLIGANIFRPLFSWILGALFYSLILAGFHYLFYNHFLRNLHIGTGLIIFIGWLVFFTFFYYFHGLDNIKIFSWFSMPYNSDADIKSYYWLSLGIVGWIFYRNFRNL